jgi:hypothetical protein
MLQGIGRRRHPKAVGIPSRRLSNMATAKSTDAKSTKTTIDQLVMAAEELSAAALLLRSRTDGIGYVAGVNVNAAGEHLASAANYFKGAASEIADRLAE